MSIDAISSDLSSILGTNLASSAAIGSNNQDSVQSTFSQILDSLSATQNTSDDLIQQLALGENVDVHDVTIASAETEVNFRIALGIRDRLVDSYKEIMRMTV